MLPRVIYTYWDTPLLPPIVQHCIESWKTHNPDWDVVVVDKQHALDRLAAPDWFDTLVPQHQADWVRLKLLARNGGVWLDATVYLLQPVTAWANRPDTLTLFAIGGIHLRNQEENRRRVFGPHCDGFIQFESWAFACPPNHDFMTAWLQQFERGVTMGSPAYVSWLKENNLYPRCYTEATHALPYFIVYLASAVVFHKGLYSQPLQVHRSSISIAESILALCRPPQGQLFYKMTGNNRRCFEVASNHGLYVPGSLAQIAYGMPKDPWPGRARLLAELLLLSLVIRIALH